MTPEEYELFRPGTVVKHSTGLYIINYMKAIEDGKPSIAALGHVIFKSYRSTITMQMTKVTKIPGNRSELKPKWYMIAKYDSILIQNRMYMIDSWAADSGFIDVTLVKYLLGG